MSKTKGVLYGVSVGPGDPELLTVKALKTMERCSVIAVPRTAGKHTMALDIAAQTVSLSEKKVLYLDFLMSPDAEAMARRHGENAQKLAAFLEAGEDVALLSIGDVSVFSTFSYMAQQIQKMGYRSEMIPGVTSFCACAALAGQSLTEMSEPLYICPASYPGLESILDRPGGKVLMKPAKGLSSLRALIEKKGLQSKTKVVVDCGLPSQRVGLWEEPVEESYFTTVLIRP